MVKYVFKIIIIGPGAVGKTSLLIRYVQNRFKESYKETIGVDFMSKIVEVSEEDAAKLTIWDIGGQEKYKFLHESFYEKANGALIVFDLSRPETSNEINKWIEEVKKFAGEKVPFILIGNKLDLIQDIGISIEKQKMEEIVKKHGGTYIETSAKTGDNVAQAFIDLTRVMIKVFSYLG